MKPSIFKKYLNETVVNESPMKNDYLELVDDLITAYHKSKNKDLDPDQLYYAISYLAQKIVEDKIQNGEYTEEEVNKSKLKELL